MKEMIYKTLILDDRYKYILSGLLNTIVMAFFCGYYRYYIRVNSFYNKK